MIKIINNLQYRKAWIISGLLVLCISGFFEPAAAQSQSDVLNRLNRIENEINTLNRAVYKGDVSPSASSSGGGALQANAEVRMQQLERELQDVRGILEEQSHALRQMKDQLDRALTDMELRLGDLETGGAQASNNARVGNYPYGGASPAPAESYSDQPVVQGRLGTLSQSSETGALSASASDQAASLYENAFAKMKSGQYDAAEVEFQSFIGQYPDHVLTSNAKYWLGETYYVRGSYERAARLFAEGYKQYPNGAKAPDNLLKLGMSLSGMGNKQDACVAFGQLQQAFAGKSQPVMRRAEQEMARIGCSG